MKKAKSFSDLCSLRSWWCIAVCFSHCKLQCCGISKLRRPGI